MYKAIQNKKYYLAVNTFRRSAKDIQLKSKAYTTGLRKWESDDMKTFALVIGTFRIMFGIKKPVLNCCNGC